MKKTTFNQSEQKEISGVFSGLKFNGKLSERLASASEYRLRTPTATFQQGTHSTV